MVSETLKMIGGLITVKKPMVLRVVLIQKAKKHEQSLQEGSDPKAGSPEEADIGVLLAKKREQSLQEGSDPKEVSLEKADIGALLEP
ncbi:hypothetical protein SUGI_0039780 [Cryptomeria japonica]|nr:hypothetical protein SUGI_0039780 [Cryptomeria japonica]